MDTFPVRNVSDEFVFGKKVDGGVLYESDRTSDAASLPPWIDEIQYKQYEALSAGSFQLPPSS